MYKDEAMQLLFDYLFTAFTQIVTTIYSLSHVLPASCVRIEKLSKTDIMLTQNILLAFALSAVGLAQQDLDNNDIPTQCSVICSGLVQLTQTCDEQNSMPNNQPYAEGPCTRLTRDFR